MSASTGGAVPDISLMGLVFRSLDVLPPQLRLLRRHAHHVEMCRAVPPPDPAGIGMAANLDVA